MNDAGEVEELPVADKMALAHIRSQIAAASISSILTITGFWNARCPRQ